MKTTLVKLGKNFLFALCAVTMILTACTSDSLFEIDLEWLVFVGIFAPMYFMYLMHKRWDILNAIED